MVVLSAACVVSAVNMLYTLGALKSKKLFIPAGKWSPLSFVMLTHQASISYNVIPILFSFRQICRPKVAAFFSWTSTIQLDDQVVPHSAVLSLSRRVDRIAFSHPPWDIPICTTGSCVVWHRCMQSQLGTLYSTTPTDLLTAYKKGAVASPRTRRVW